MATFKIRKPRTPSLGRVAMPTYRSPSALYGNPSGLNLMPPPPAPLASTSAGLGAGTGGTVQPGMFAQLGQFVGSVPRWGGTIHGVPMVKTQQQPDPFAALTDAQIQARA